MGMSFSYSPKDKKGQFDDTLEALQRYAGKVYPKEFSVSAAHF